MRLVFASIIVFSISLASPLAAFAADGMVTGVITLKGKPLTGKIAFRWKDQFVGSKVQKDGTYAVDRLAAGTYTVTIEGKNVPEKFSSEEKSSLTVEAKVGDNVFDFDLQ